MYVCMIHVLYSSTSWILLLYQQSRQSRDETGFLSPPTYSTTVCIFSALVGHTHEQHVCELSARCVILGHCNKTLCIGFNKLRIYQVYGSTAECEAEIAYILYSAVVHTSR